jgi:hypothetical protein
MPSVRKVFIIIIIIHFLGAYRAIGPCSEWKLLKLKLEVREVEKGYPPES